MQRNKPVTALLRQWTRSLPEPQRGAVIGAVETASLAQVRRALRLLEQLAAGERGPLIKVELLSTFNLEPLLPVLEFALGSIPSRPSIQLAPLNDIESYIAQGGNRQESPDVRVLTWRVEEVIPEALYPFSHGFPDALETRAEEVLARIERVIALHAEYARGIPLFVSTFWLPAHFSNPLFMAQHQAGLFSLLARINRRVYEIATRNIGVHVLDLAAWAASQGSQQADATLDFVARQPLTAKGQLSFALFLARSLRPLFMPRRKVLGLDLDNTLWGGVIGEDGLHGLKLGHDFPGNVHLRIQRELIELRNRGVLLVLLSKNNESDAREAFDSLPDMLLKWEDFAVRKIDWNHKHENLRDAARQLGLSLDSFVFLDDSDYEREQVRQLMPEVLILNESADPLHILQSLWETDAFDSLAISEEDRRRHQDYAARTARDVRPHQGNLEEFLKSLQMEVTIEKVGPSNLDRVVTMLGKTNQFNLTTRRHARAAVQGMLDSRGSIALALRLRDKFGDQGIVAVLLALPERNGTTLTVDSFLVSCRALGRGVEDALWAAMVSRAQQQQVRRLEAEYIVSPKNSIVARLYDRLGLRQRTEEPGGTKYELNPLEAYPFPSWITCRNESNAE